MTKWPVIRIRAAAVAVLAGLALGATTPACATQDNPPPTQANDLSGLHAFDLRAGTWIVHHRRLKERLAGSTEWESFDGTQTWWPVMDGWGNVDDNLFHTAHGDLRGVTLRAYDPKTGQWAIWWLDGRNPFGDLDPPMKGRFANGVGLFYADDTLRGKPVKVRFIWSNITPASAHWEQAFSPDGGKTWETNWITDFTKAN